MSAACKTPKSRIAPVCLVGGRASHAHGQCKSIGGGMPAPSQLRDILIENLYINPGGDTRIDAPMYQRGKRLEKPAAPRHTQSSKFPLVNVQVVLRMEKANTGILHQLYPM